MKITQFPSKEWDVCVTKLAVMTMPLSFASL